MVLEPTESESVLDKFISDPQLSDPPAPEPTQFTEPMVFTADEIVLPNQDQDFQLPTNMKSEFPEEIPQKEFEAAEQP